MANGAAGNVSIDEARAAEAFLSYLKVDWKDNPFLVTAIVAWFRQESGSLSHVIGNNAFNLRPGADDAKFRSGVRRSKNGNGMFSVYATLEQGFRAAANRLLSAGHDWRGYDAIIRAARDGAHAGMTKDQQTRQGLAFLTALALSAWDAGHYGAPDGNPQTNHLVRVWASITGLPGNWKALPPKKPGVKKKKPKVPAALVRGPAGDPAKPQFLDPHHARAFYKERHRKSHVLPPMGSPALQ